MGVDGDVGQFSAVSVDRVLEPAELSGDGLGDSGLFSVGNLFMFDHGLEVFSYFIKVALFLTVCSEEKGVLIYHVGETLTYYRSGGLPVTMQSGLLDKNG